MTYRDKRLGFEITFPSGWRCPAFLHKLFRLPLRLMFASPALAGGPEFYGPSGDSIKLAVGPISPVPSVSQHQRNVQAMAVRHGHRVLKVATIAVAGKSHATMAVDIPSPTGSMRLKNYFLIFGRTEYVVTASLEAGEEEYDAIVKTFRPL